MDNFSYPPPSAATGGMPGSTPSLDTEFQREIRGYLHKIAKYLRIMCLLQMDDQRVRQLQTQYRTLFDMEAFTEQRQRRRGGNDPFLLLLELLDREGEC